MLPGILAGESKEGLCVVKGTRSNPWGPYKEGKKGLGAGWELHGVLGVQGRGYRRVVVGPGNSCGSLGIRRRGKGGVEWSDGNSLGSMEIQGEGGGKGCVW